MVQLYVNARVCFHTRKGILALLYFLSRPPEYTLKSICLQPRALERKLQAIVPRPNLHRSPPTTWPQTLINVGFVVNKYKGTTRQNFMDIGNQSGHGLSNFKPLL